jgi:hypothetical protein
LLTCSSCFGDKIITTIFIKFSKFQRFELEEEEEEKEEEKEEEVEKERDSSYVLMGVIFFYHQ